GPAERHPPDAPPDARRDQQGAAARRRRPLVDRAGRPGPGQSDRARPVGRHLRAFRGPRHPRDPVRGHPSTEPAVSDMSRLPVVAVVLTGLLLSSCSIVGGGGGGNYQLTAWFPKTIALVPASDVKVLGLSAGKVKDVKVDRGRVRVVLNIKKSVPVPADVHAEIIPQSLIGERYVQLFPAWTDGQSRARNGDVIPEDRTAVPVEPDEALAALKKFLDSLDPNATGRLVQNAANDLSGNGQNLN